AGGTIFAWTAEGTFRIVHAFRADDPIAGSQPMGQLTLGADGALYGATLRGGAHGAGTIFAIERDGTFKLLAALPAGSRVLRGVIFGPDGALYGTSGTGGSGGGGYIFRLQP